MLRICSNGFHIRTHYSIFLEHLLQYSKSSSENGKSPLSILDFLVKSLGFSKQEASTVLSKVSSSHLINPKQNPILVVDFLRKRGFEDTQIKKVISCWPQLLNCNVDKTLLPKFDALQEMGIFGSDLGEILASNCSLFWRKLTKIVPMICFIKSNIGSDEKLLKFLRRSHWLMFADVVTKLQPNIDLLRKYGLSDKRIFRILNYNGHVFLHDPKKLEEFILRVDKELQIPFDSACFPDALVLISSFGDENRDVKFKVFRSYGWTDMDIMIMVRKIPRFFAFSERNINERLEFFVNELGFEPRRLAESPNAMIYSMKQRTLPRYALLKGLKERNIGTGKTGILTALCISEAAFLKKFVLPYMDDFPELCKAYTCRVKGVSSS